MNEVSKEDLKIAAEVMFNQVRHQEKLCVIQPQSAPAHRKKAEALRRVARVLKEKSK